MSVGSAVIGLAEVPQLPDFHTLLMEMELALKWLLSYLIISGEKKKNCSNQLLWERGQMFGVSIIELFQSDKQRRVLCN